MNKIRTNIVMAVMVLAMLTFLASEAMAQIVEPRQSPLTGILEQDNSAEGRGTLKADFSDSLSCDRQKFHVQGGFISIIHSFRQTAPGNVEGSWTVRSLFPAKGSRPETVVAHYFDGRFSGGTVDLGSHTFDLRGTTNYSGLCSRDISTNKNVRIWGNCLAGVINFEVTDREGRFAHGTFQGKATCGIGPRSVNTMLDRH